MRACAWGLAKLSPSPPVASPCRLRPARAAGMESHSGLATFGCWLRGCGSPVPPSPRPSPFGGGGHPRASWYLLDFLGEVLGDDPSFHLLLLVFACREGQHPTSPSHREIIFFPNKQQQNPTGKFAEESSAFTGANPSLWGGHREPLLREEGDAGHSTPIFPARAWGLAAHQELGLKKKSPKVIKPLEVAAFPLSRSAGWAPLHHAVRLGVPVPGASLKLKTTPAAAWTPPDLCFPPLVMP